MRLVQSLSLASMLISSWTAEAIVPSQAPFAWDEYHGDIQVKQKTFRIKLKQESSLIKPNLESQSLSSLEDALTGTNRLIWGSFAADEQLQASKPQAFVDLALDYVDSHPELFGLRSSELRESSKARYIGKNEQFIKFDVYRKGTLIEDANVLFRYKEGQLAQIVNHSFSEAQILPANPRSDLANIAQKLLPGQTIAPKGYVYRLVEDGNRYALKLVAAYTVTDRDHKAYTLQLDSSSATVFELRAEHFNFQGEVKGDTYPRWYGDTYEKIPLKFVDLITRAGKIQSSLEGTFLAAEDDEPGIEGLKGVHVAVEDASNSIIKENAIRQEGSWQLYLKRDANAEAHADTRIAQNMVYDKVTRIALYAKNFIDTPFLGKALPAMVNLGSTCNAWSTDDAIGFYGHGRYCANTALIADVIYHEWGHSLHRSLGRIQDAALSEGFGDTLSLLMTGSPKLAQGFFLNDENPLRDLSVPKVYPQDRGEQHDEGLIIASTFWDLLVKLNEKYGAEKAKGIFANFVFKMIFTAPTYQDVYQALLLIDAPDSNLEKASPNLCILNEVFVKHGLAEEDQRCKAS